MTYNDDTNTEQATTEPMTVWVFRPGFGWVERPATA
jgi:hypothetical protein